jgi:hypothetical protein
VFATIVLFYSPGVDVPLPRMLALALVMGSFAAGLSCLAAAIRTNHLPVRPMVSVLRR